MRGTGENWGKRQRRALHTSLLFGRIALEEMTGLLRKQVLEALKNRTEGRGSFAFDIARLFQMDDGNGEVEIGLITDIMKKLKPAHPGKLCWKNSSSR